MSNESKYYQPKIEEFHVGFEYEIFEDFDSLPERIWHEQVFGDNRHNPEEMGFVSIGYLDKFRVKYLDREDIESLGWFFKRNVHAGNDYYWSTNFLHSMIYSPIKKRMVITIRDEQRGEDYTAFVGFIKNKSELKKLIQQLNIQ